MKRILISILALTLSAGLMAQLSCYDVQYTADASGDSPYKGQSVTVQGIVTAKRSGAFYIGDAEGGPWSGLYVFHGITSNLVQVGDMVKLTGIVEEYNGLTELTNVSASEVLSGNNPVPITTISTAALPLGGRVGEPYEGVMVRFNDVQIKSTMDTYGVYKIADSSNALTSVDDVMYLPQASQIIVGEWWSQIQGVVDYFSGAGGYRVLPRNANDMIKVDDVSYASIRIGSESNAVLDEINTLNVYTSKLKSEWGIREYEMKFRIDPSQILYQGFEIAGSLSLFNPTETISAAGDIITLHYGGQDNLVSETDDGVLIKLKFEPKTYGEIGRASCRERV